MSAASPSSPRFLKLLSADSAKGAAICILADVMHQDDDAAEMPLYRLARVHLRVHWSICARRYSANPML
jgi:hypothetical protein